MTTLIAAHNGRGPIHAEAATRENEWGALAWCGMRPQFRHARREGAAAEVTCKRCIAAMAQGRPRAWSSS